MCVWDRRTDTCSFDVVHLSDVRRTLLVIVWNRKRDQKKRIVSVEEPKNKQKNNNQKNPCRVRVRIRRRWEGVGKVGR